MILDSGLNFWAWATLYMGSVIFQHLSSSAVVKFKMLIHLGTEHFDTLFINEQQFSSSV